MKELGILGIVKVGKFIASDMLEFKQLFYKFEGKLVELFVKRYVKEKSRSGQQNRYLHGVVFKHVIEAIKDTWGEDWTLGQAKQYCKENCNGVIKSQHGNCNIYESTALYTNEQMMLFISTIQSFFAVNFNYYIPEAKEI